MKAPEVVRRYATTLLEAAEESNQLDSVRGDVQGLRQTLDQSEELAAFVGNRYMSAVLQRGALERLFDGRVQSLTLNFLLLLTERRRIDRLPEMLELFEALYDEKSGVITAEVRSAVPLGEDQVGRLRQRLAEISGKEVRLQVEVDPAVRGGAVAKVGDTVYDGSVATYLERLHRHLVGS
jgi:F-type H+-transporting ATPase subunit delta